MEVLDMRQWKWLTRFNGSGGHASMEVLDMHQWKRWTCINGSVGHASMEEVNMHQWKCWTRINGSGKNIGGNSQTLSQSDGGRRVKRILV